MSDWLQDAIAKQEAELHDFVRNSVWDTWYLPGRDTLKTTILRRMQDGLEGLRDSLSRRPQSGPKNRGDLSAE